MITSFSAVRMKACDNTEHLLQSTRNNNNNYEMYDNEMNEVYVSPSMKSEENINAKTRQGSIRSKNIPLEYIDKASSQNSMRNDLPTVHSLKLSNENKNKKEGNQFDHYQAINDATDSSSSRQSQVNVSKTDCNENTRTEKYSNFPLYKSSIKTQSTIFNPHSPLTSIAGERNSDFEDHVSFKSLPSLKPNRSIYKLAYDESLTDQSETDEANSPPKFFDWTDNSVFDSQNPESQVPSSIPSAEILIHEADSASEAGSEDVELLPHRYESESFLNDSKHMYVNKLSLAVELLRTRENLPYDEEFKRIEGENNGKLAKTYPGEKSDAKSGFVNRIFVDDQLQETENLPVASGSECVTGTKKLSEAEDIKHNYQCFTINDGGDDEDNVQSFEVSCEAAKEACEEQCAERQKDLWTETDEVRASYFRFGVHAQHRFNIFSPRTSVVNPCFCCVIM